MKTAKNHITIFALLSLMFIFGACSKDEDAVPKPKLTHTGEKWNIASVEYTIIDQNLSNPAQGLQNGTKTNAGAFYFNGSEGSFDIVIGKSRYEDYFSYSDEEGDVTIISIDQGVSGTKVSQNIIALTGERETTTINLSGTVISQDLTQQFVFTGTFELVKD